MTETTAILAITLVALGAYNWHLHTIIQSPGVTICPPSKVSIHPYLVDDKVTAGWSPNLNH